MPIYGSLGINRLRMHKTQIIIFILLTALAQFSAGQWRGPERDGHFPERGLLTVWPDGGPELILKVSGIGEGFSSPVLHRGTIYITGKKDTLDYLVICSPTGKQTNMVAYNKFSGELVWQTEALGGQRSYPCHLECDVEGTIRTIYTNTPLYRGREIFITSGYNIHP